MTPEDVKNFYGSSYRFHKETGMSHSSLNNWRRWGFVPIKSQVYLQEVTKGELRADLRVHYTQPRF